MCAMSYGFRIVTVLNTSKATAIRIPIPIKTSIAMTSAVVMVTFFGVLLSVGGSPTIPDKSMYHMCYYHCHAHMPRPYIPVSVPHSGSLSNIIRSCVTSRLYSAKRLVFTSPFSYTIIEICSFSFCRLFIYIYICTLACMYCVLLTILVNHWIACSVPVLVKGDVAL